MAEGNGAAAPATTEAEQPKHYRLDRQTGEVIVELDGREHHLRPTMAAAEEIEAALGWGVEMERTRLAATCWPWAEQVMRDPKLLPTTAELAVIFRAAVRAGGDLAMTIDQAKKIVWTHRTLVAVPLWEFVWATADGGRLRADDLKNDGSPLGSRPETNGGDKKVAETASQLTEELEAGRHSGDTLD